MKVYAKVPRGYARGGIGNSRLRGSLFNLIFSWKTVYKFLYLFFILTSIILSVSDAVKTKSVVPVFVEVGGRMVNADALLYHHATNSSAYFDTSEIDQKAKEYNEFKPIDTEGMGFVAGTIAQWKNDIDRIKKLVSAWYARAAHKIKLILYYVYIFSAIYTFVVTYKILVWIIMRWNTSGEAFAYGIAVPIILFIGMIYGGFVYFAVDQNHCSAPITPNQAIFEYGKAINPIKGLIYTATHYQEVFKPLISTSKKLFPETERTDTDLFSNKTIINNSEEDT